MLVDKINVAELFCAKSPSLARCKEGDLPLLNFSNLTCMSGGALNIMSMMRNVLSQGKHMESIKGLSVSYGSKVMRMVKVIVYKRHQQ